MANGTGVVRSTTEYTAIDILGRVTSAKQTTDGGDPNGYSTGYVYNLSGALIEETYPSGRVVKNVLDNNGDLSIVRSKKTAASGYWNYADNFAYNAAGAVTSMQLGNGTWESTAFNSWLQPTQIALGVTQNATGLLDLDYTYGTTNNNGNVMTQTITVPTIGANPGFVATQTYSYDSLNRLLQATETIPNQTGWNQTFSYDRYGNRNFVEAPTTTLLKQCNNNTEVCPADRAKVNPSIDVAKNRLVGYAFDNAGNTTTDANSQTFIYDAENKQVQVNNATGIIGQYFYDGDGKRVKKIVPGTGETTIFAYDAAGKLVAEYSTIVEPAATAKVSYLTNDHLGSPRITTDAVGQTISRRDFMPFGEEIARANYATDSVRQKFTGYERDNEVDLDFAQARYYNKNHGRFTSVDTLLASGTPGNPQTWNRYSYVINNPLILVDPTGLIWGISGSDVRWFATEALMKEAKFEAYTPPNWTYQHGDQWVTLNPDGPGSCNAAYDCSNVYFTNGWTYSSDPSTWRKPEAGIQDVSVEFYTAVLGIGSVVKKGVEALASALLKQSADEGAEVIVGTASKTIEAATSTTTTAVESTTAQTASTAFGRSVQSLQQTLRNGSGTWQRISAHVENAVGRAYRGGTSIEEVFVNKQTGERIIRHVVVRGEQVLHETFRTYGKFGK